MLENFKSFRISPSIDVSAVCLRLFNARKYTKQFHMALYVCVCVCSFLVDWFIVILRHMLFLFDPNFTYYVRSLIVIDVKLHEIFMRGYNRR